MKKICVVSSTRADYGLLLGISRELSANTEVDFRLVATGTHLKRNYGHTIDAIIKDGFSPVSIDIGMDGDRPADILKTMAKTLTEFSEYFTANRPDILILLGDRFEILAVAEAALVHNIPVAHIHGGEVTEGAIDDSCRHAITKIASLHFTSNEEHRKRVIQLGEAPSRVFNFGAPGLDNILNFELMKKNDLEESLGIKFNKKNILVTFHPVTTSEEETLRETQSFFKALALMDKDVSFIVTMPNADTYNGIVTPIIEKFKEEYPDRVHVFTSLGQLRYLSMMKFADVIAGNSSSGIIEAPFMNRAVVNVGDRQKGRSTSQHVIHSSGELSDIQSAFKMALSDEFQGKLKTFPSIYGDGKSSKKIAEELFNHSAKNLLPKKFFNL